MNASELPKPTPEYMLKPHLVYCGRLLGMNLYIDVGWRKGWDLKLAMVTNLLRQTFHSPKDNE